MGIKGRGRRRNWKWPLIIAALLFALGAFSYLLWKKNAYALQVADLTSRAGRALWYNKDLRFGGLRVLKEKDFLLEGPRAQSILWWILHAPEIEAEILQNTMVSSVRVTRCHAWSWGCFDITVQERNPVMLALVGDKTWVVGDDGGFIAPLKGPASGAQQLSQAEVADLLGSPVVEGLVPSAAAPEAIKPRLRYARQALGVLNAAGLDVRTVKLRDNGEMEVRFRGRDFVAVFSLAAEDMNRLDLEVQRLKRVLKEYGEGASRIAQIDLAFEKQAVVRMQPTPVPVKTSTLEHK